MIDVLSWILRTCFGLVRQPSLLNAITRTDHYWLVERYVDGELQHIIIPLSDDDAEMALKTFMANDGLYMGSRQDLPWSRICNYSYR